MRGGHGGAGWAGLCVRVIQWGQRAWVCEGGAGRAKPQMCIQERLLGASRAREGVRGLLGHAQIMSSRALSVGARGPGRGREGMAMCTSEAMGAASLDVRGQGCVYE